MEKHQTKYSHQDPWTQYRNEYKKRHPEKAARWQANGYANQLRKYIKEHPEHAEEIRERVFGE